jgi:hypothetical protein
MPLDSLPLVRLITERYRTEGVAADSLGIILDVYEDGYEVEFSREDGSTIAWFAVGRDEVEPLAEASAPVAHHPD